MLLHKMKSMIWFNWWIHWTPNSYKSFWDTIRREGSQKKLQVGGELVQFQFVDTKSWYYYGRHGVDEKATIGKYVSFLKNKLYPKIGKWGNLDSLLLCARRIQSWYTTNSRSIFSVVMLNISPRPNSSKYWQIRWW